MIISFTCRFHPLESPAEQEKQARPKGQCHNYNARRYAKKGETRRAAIISSPYNNVAWDGYKQLQNTAT